MFKKLFLILFLIFFQSSKVYSSEFTFEVYGLKINFIKVKVNFAQNKFFSIINSQGLIGYFVEFSNIIQTTFNSSNNNLNYFFNIKKKDKEKIYQYVKQDGKILIDNTQLKKGKNYKEIQHMDLVGTVDPLTAVHQILFNNNLDHQCGSRAKIYDGDDVYEVYLSPRKLDKLSVDYKKQNFQIIFSCRLNYKAISGHKFEREQKLNSRYLDVYFSKINNSIIPVYFETKSKFIKLKMYLSTILTP